MFLTSSAILLCSLGYVKLSQPTSSHSENKDRKSLAKSILVSSPPQKHNCSVLYICVTSPKTYSAYGSHIYKTWASTVNTPDQFIFASPAELVKSVPTWQLQKEIVPTWVHARDDGSHKDLQKLFADSVLRLPDSLDSFAIDIEEQVCVPICDEIIVYL
jgi:hypothetical protein